MKPKSLKAHPSFWHLTSLYECAFHQSSEYAFIRLLHSIPLETRCDDLGKSADLQSAYRPTLPHKRCCPTSRLFQLSWFRFPLQLDHLLDCFCNIDCLTNPVPTPSRSPPY